MGEATREWSVTIDHDRRRIVTTWGPSVTDAGLSAYQRGVSLHPDHRGYDELIDFLATDQVRVQTASLQGLAVAGAARDPHEQPSRLVLVVRPDYHFGLARMYASYRDAQDGSRRELRIFTSREDADAYLASVAGAEA
jgi:hypothetical protein